MLTMHDTHKSTCHAHNTPESAHTLPTDKLVQTNAKEVSRRACNQTAEERAKMRNPFCLS